MGLVFFRKVSRTGVSYAWPEMLPGQWVFDRPSHIVFDNLKPRRLVELLPSVTYGVNQAREESSSAWAEADNDAHVGASGKFGITSAVTLDGTINPDFSQVESDAFQIEVNRRFPVFFSEKRPFFMEGMGLFNIARGDNMRTAVHTRRIVDPIFGAKLTGTLGKTTFGVLNSLDDHPGDIGDRGDEFADRNKLFTIGRATYALRRSDYVGGDPHADRACRPQQLRHRRRLFDQAIVVAIAVGNVPDVGDQRIGDRHERQYRGAVVRTRDAPFYVTLAGRALRPRLPDGHGVLQPHRIHVRLHLQRSQLLSGRRTELLAPAHPSVRVREVRPRRHPGWRRSTSSTRACSSISPGRALSNIATSRGNEAWQGRQFDSGNDIFLFGRHPGAAVVRAFSRAAALGPGSTTTRSIRSRDDRSSASTASRSSRTST